MADIDSARFITRLEVIGRELEDLKLRRVQRHEEFVRRLDDMKERCDKVTDHRMQRLKAEGIAIETELVKDVSRSYRKSYSKSATTLEQESDKRSDRARSSECYRSHSPPRLRMELSFHSTEGIVTPKPDKQTRDVNTFKRTRTKYMEGLITSKGNRTIEYKLEDRLSSSEERPRKTSLKWVNLYSTESVENHEQLINSVPNDKKAPKGQQARQNFKRISNKLNSVMKLMSHRRNTLAPAEMATSNVHLFTKVKQPDETNNQRSGSMLKRQHVLNRNERTARIRLYSEGSGTSTSEAKRKLRRVYMTIQGTKQLLRK